MKPKELFHPNGSCRYLSLPFSLARQLIQKAVEHEKCVFCETFALI